MKIEIDRIIGYRIKYIIENELEVIALLTKNEFICQLSIGFRLITRSEHNVIIKPLQEVNGNYVLYNKFIEHPPFRFISRYILKEKSLESFWKNLSNHFYNETSLTKDKIITCKYSKINRLYFHYYRSTKYSMSEELREKIKFTYGLHALKWFDENKLQAVFTDDIEKARTLIFHNKKND